MIQCSNEKTSKDMNGNESKGTCHMKRQSRHENGNESKGSVRSGPQERATRRGSQDMRMAMNRKGQSDLVLKNVPHEEAVARVSQIWSSRMCHTKRQLQGSVHTIVC